MRQADSQNHHVGQFFGKVLAVVIGTSSAASATSVVISISADRISFGSFQSSAVVTFQPFASLLAWMSCQQHLTRHSASLVPRSDAHTRAG